MVDEEFSDGDRIPRYELVDALKVHGLNYGEAKTQITVWRSNGTPGTVVRAELMLPTRPVV